MKGYPDDFGVQQFPSFGAFTTASGSTAALANAWKDIVTITGKGQLYGGELFIAAPGLNVSSRIRLVIDGTTAFYTTLSGLLAESSLGIFAVPMLMVKYDSLNSAFVVALAPGITFTTSYVVQFYEVGALLPNIGYNLWYTSIV